MSLGKFGEFWGHCLDLCSQSVFPELPLRRQLFATRSQLGSQPECLRAGLRNFWPLPGPLQSECVSRAPLKEAAFCSQVQAGIPPWMSSGRFGKFWGHCLDLSNQNVFPDLPLSRQLFATRPQLGSQPECLWAGLGNFGPLPGLLQSEYVSRAPLKEATACIKVPAGIPT